MSNYSIKIDLQKIQGAFVKEITGKSATKKCICIPIEECDYIFPGKQGVYLNATALEMREPKYGESHMIKPNISREAREMMSEEDRNSLPILGRLKPLTRKSDSPAPVPDMSSAMDSKMNDDPDGDLPF